MELFRRRARVVTYKDGLFLEPSWLAVYFGQRVMPDRMGSARRCARCARKSQRQLQSVREQVQSTVVRMPTHEEFPGEVLPGGAADERGSPGMTATITRVVVVGGGVGGLARGRGTAARLSQAWCRRARGGHRPACGFARRDAGRCRHSAACMALLGMPETDLIRRTGATFKLATEHVGWQGDGSRFLHAHGDIGTRYRGYALLQVPGPAGDSRAASKSPENYSLAAVAARLGRFARPMGDEKALTSSFTYGFHLDEAAYVAYPRGACGATRRAASVGAARRGDTAAGWRSGSTAAGERRAGRRRSVPRLQRRRIAAACVISAMPNAKTGRPGCPAIA